MKIATMVKGYITSPAPSDIIYAPIDLAMTIAQQLTKRGHQIDYYGPRGTAVPGVPVVTCGLEPLVHTMDDYVAKLFSPGWHSDNVLATWDEDMAREMFTRAGRGEYDLLFFHHPEVMLAYTSLFPDVPVTYVMHDPIEPLQYDILQHHLTPNQHVISLSNQQRQPAPDLPYSATIYNGIDSDKFTISEQPRDDYLLFLARVMPHKGAKEAVQVALKSGHQLLIIGSVNQDYQAYFDEHVKPFLGEQIRYLGHLPHDQVAPYVQHAKALLMPIQWEEPFGLTMIEAMACGTPVIALRRGSVPEVVVDKKTGFIVDSIGEMIEAVDKLHTINPQICRQHVLDHFSIQKMVDSYETVFQTILTPATATS